MSGYAWFLARTRITNARVRSSVYTSISRSSAQAIAVVGIARLCEGSAATIAANTRRKVSSSSFKVFQHGCLEGVFAIQSHLYETVDSADRRKDMYDYGWRLLPGAGKPSDQLLKHLG